MKMRELASLSTCGVLLVGAYAAAEPVSRMTVAPPAGRLAIVLDGNSPDPDDIGATAVMLGLLSRTGLADRLVHLSHSCDLRPTERISKCDERRRQRVLGEVCETGVRRFGPFRRLDRWFNCRTDQNAAVRHLSDAINASTKEDPLWIIEAGEPDVIGYALHSSDASHHRHVHVVSHHPANDNSGDYFTWSQILAFGVKEHQIVDQNQRLQSPVDAWDWAHEHPSPDVAWVWDCLAYAERDPVVRFQHGKFDCSDAGMVVWWLAGASPRRNQTATPRDIRSLLETSATDASSRP